jgi:hypothetical protein
VGTKGERFLWLWCVGVGEGWVMCEFRVLLEGERVFEDAVFCGAAERIVLAAE